MTREWRKVAAIALMFGTLAGCMTPGEEEPSRPANWKLPATSEKPLSRGMSSERAARARKLYALKCAKCHGFYDPALYSASEWNEWMMKMSKKSRLQPEQEELIT